MIDLLFGKRLPVLRVAIRGKYQANSYCAVGFLNFSQYTYLGPTSWH
jgi:hypothetical protein